MINFIAVKYFVCFLLSHIHLEETQYTYISSTILAPQYPTQLEETKLTAPYSVIEGNIVRNATTSMLQIRFPRSVPFCPSFQLMAPTMTCYDETLLNLDDFRNAFDPSFIYGGFGIKHTPGNLNHTIYQLLASNTYNLDYLDKSFPAWFINSTAPMPFLTNCAQCRDAPDIEGFLVDGSVGTLLDYGLYYGGMYTVSSYKTFWGSFSKAFIDRSVLTGEVTAGTMAAGGAVGTAIPEAIALEAIATASVAGVVPTAAQLASATSSTSINSFKSVLSSVSSGVSDAMQM